MLYYMCTHDSTSQVSHLTLVLSETKYTNVLLKLDKSRLIDIPFFWSFFMFGIEVIKRNGKWLGLSHLDYITNRLLAGNWWLYQNVFLK